MHEAVLLLRFLNVIYSHHKLSSTPLCLLIIYPVNVDLCMVAIAVLTANNACSFF